MTTVSAAVVPTDTPSSPLDLPHQSQREETQVAPRIKYHQQKERDPSITVYPSFLPDLPPHYRSLLDYFTRVADSFSCDELVKRDFYTTLMPMAISKSHVMASMLNLAAVHRVNAGLTQNPTQLALLQVVTVEQLRSKVSHTFGCPTDDIVATVLMLCYSDIVAGGDRAHSWRLHLEGAASLFTHDTAWTTNSRNPASAFLARCFVSLVALANVSGHPPTEGVSRQALQMIERDGQPGHIDEFTAYSIDLVQIFVEIGTLLRNRDGVLNEIKLQEDESLKLVQRVQKMVNNQQPALEKGVLSTLSSTRKEEYLKINESYHQAALLHIYQRIRGLLSSAAEVQETVHRILALLSGIKLVNGPCPGIVLLFPLFSAGCGAIESDDRQQVRTLLTDMVKMFGINTVQHSLKVLEALWTHRDVYGESETSIAWETFIGKYPDALFLNIVEADVYLDGNIDLILY